MLKGILLLLDILSAPHLRRTARLRRILILSVCGAGLLLAALLAIRFQDGGRSPLGQKRAAAASLPTEDQNSGLPTSQDSGLSAGPDAGGSSGMAQTAPRAGAGLAPHAPASPTPADAGTDEGDSEPTPVQTREPAPGDNSPGSSPGDPAPAEAGPEAGAAPAGSASPASAGSSHPASAPGPETGTLYLALDESGYTHLFAYHPQSLPLTRLTAGAWDDVTPAPGPDGSRLAFASDRDGSWDLYLLDLASGQIDRLTHTPEYEAAPSWSPDGRWLAYEAYTGPEGGLDIFLLPVTAGAEPEGTPVRLTDDPAADHSPAWDPAGRRIAFVSTRGGGPDLWLADLDRVEGRFRNLSRDGGSPDAHPAWSPDGRWLAWASSSGGLSSIFVLDMSAAEAVPAHLGGGAWPAWSPDGGTLFTALAGPNRAYLTGYAAAPGMALPPIALPGQVEGLAWSPARLPSPLPPALAEAAALELAPAWEPDPAAPGEAPSGRRSLVDLQGVAAPFALLQERAGPAFAALRSHLAGRLGWDFLAGLENAYLPLTSPPYPGMDRDWLYTGRAFAFDTAPLHAGWLVVVREDFGGEAYWRVYLRARYQDGSQGRPLNDLPWDFDARSGGDPQAYEQGGALAGSVPAGYWLDFTRAARAFGWERLPALSTWRAAYPTARFNQFVLTDGLDWYSAMEELYPPEALPAP